MEKIFDNRHIIENSQTLFMSTGYFTNQLKDSYFRNKIPKSILVEEKKERTYEDVLTDLNAENQKYNEEKIIKLLEELYDCMEKENMVNSKISSKLRIHILKSLYKFVESKNEQILINIAKIILSVSTL